MTIEEAVENLEFAQMKQEEIEECGSLEERLDAALEVDCAERALMTARLNEGA